MDNSLIELYDHFFQESHNNAYYVGMAKALKGIAVLVKDSGLIEHYREDLGSKCLSLENLAPLMDFKALDACLPTIRYVRKLLNEKPDIIWGSGLARDPTADEQLRLDTLRRDNVHISGSEYREDEGGDGFISDLMDGDSDD
jgi:hypothetical protein